SQPAVCCFSGPATSETHPLSLHDALPIFEADHLHAVYLEAVMPCRLNLAALKEHPLQHFSAVMIAGYIMHRPADAPQNFARIFVSLFVRVINHVASMQHKGWLERQVIEFFNQRLGCRQRRTLEFRLLIARIVADMGVADVDEMQ